MNYKKIILFLIVLLIIVLLAIVLYVIKLNKKNNIDLNEQTVQSQDNENNIDFKYDREINDTEDLDSQLYSDEPKEVTNKGYFKTVTNCISKYLENITELENSTDDNKSLDIKENIYAKLYEQYIKDNNITVYNVDNYVTFGKKNVKINGIKMYQLFIRDNQVLRFVVRTRCIDNDNTQFNLNFKVYLDYKNLRYAIEPIDNNIEDLKNVNLKSDINEIENRGKNTYKYVNVDAE